MMACKFMILEELDRATREQLLADHREIQIPASHQLIFQADWGEEVYVVSAGILKARCLNPEGDEIVIPLMGPGALIGDLALLANKPIRSVDVLSVIPSTLLKLRARSFQECLASSEPLNQALTRLQAQRLTALGDRLMLMNEDATTRLLATLLDLACLNGPGDDPLQPIPAIPQQEIAAIAGLSRGTTSTLINKLRGNGTLRQVDDGLQFANLSALKRRNLLP
jgi:CRP/FNR family cyclic AMP-dependent transcriptional regulator